MLTAVFLLIFINLGLTGLLAYLLLRQRGLLDILATEAAKLRGLNIVKDSGMLAKENSHIRIKILNPLELASKEHWLAGTLGSIAPAVVNAVVYQKASKMIADELVPHGVKADVRVVHER